MNAFFAFWGASGDMAELAYQGYAARAGSGDRATPASDPSTEAGGYTAGRGPAARRASPFSPLEPPKAINANHRTEKAGDSQSRHMRLASGGWYEHARGTHPG